MTERVNDLIARLSADLRPVRPLPSPFARLASWLAMVVVVGAVLSPFADLPHLAERLRAVPDMWLAVLGSSATAAGAALAAFQLSVPGRRLTWALLPLPPFLLWCLATGLGCLRSWTVPGTHAATLNESGDCFLIIIGLSIPLSALSIAMVRRAFPIRPDLTASVMGLAVAAAAATLLNLFHPYDATAKDIAFHLVGVGLVIMVNRSLGGRLLNAQ